MTDNSTPLLDGLVVVDLCQFLSGPYASLRLQDLGARVIKIERPDGGDLSRRLYLSDTEIGGDSTIFHAINRSKESLALDLKNPDDVAALRKLLTKADVVLQNFRPGVIERLGLDYEAVKAINSGIVYASITGYGSEGPWVDRPGQDLLAQARSGVMWLNGDHDQGPVPFGLAIADMLAGAAIAQGVLAALVRRGLSGQGAHIETSLLEVLVDFQFEVLTTHLNDGRRVPKRSEFRSAHAYLSAPYGVYPTADGYIAIAMTPLPRLESLLGLAELAQFADPKSWFAQRDAIKRILAEKLASQPTAHWLAILEPADIWCAKVLDWAELMASEGFRALDMLQTVTREDNVSITTTRSPLRVNGVRARTQRAAPLVGEQSAKIRAEFGL
ncbi:CaiB/BaiF CoA transferase family protein [Devosia sp. XGJD_8]|uniref:CaiB/BaiF CoA transferase family protein n=1 Tax=Devosia sp. XGJD_8 TaxID=3391187 RepID=UPI0039850DD5